MIQIVRCGVFCLLFSTEKVIKFENEMQLQRDKMTAWEKRVDEKIASLEEKEKMIAMTYKDLETNEKAVKDKMEQAVGTGIMKDGLPQMIAFKARGVTNKSPVTGDRLKFDTEVLNIGNSYNKSTGVFTAPVGGVYMFSVQICTNPKKWYIVFIMANDAAVGTASHYNIEQIGTCTTGDGFAVLEKGDTVWVRCQTGGTSIVYEDSAIWNSFSGVLIGE